MTIAGQAAVIQRTQKINPETTAHRKPQLTEIHTHGRLPDIQRREKREDYLLPSRLLEEPKTNCLNSSLHNSRTKVLVTLPPTGYDHTWKESEGRFASGPPLSQKFLEGSAQYS
jgi:hypothetical protein